MTQSPEIMREESVERPLIDAICGCDAELRQYLLNGLISFNPNSWAAEELRKINP